MKDMAKVKKNSGLGQHKRLAMGQGASVRVAQKRKRK